MKSNYIVKSIVAVAIIAMASCKPELSTVTPSKGSADFTRYIAIGNSLTSGFADGGLYLDGQQNSFPAMIAEQMKTVGGGNFSIPFFPSDKFNGSGYLILKGFNANGTPNIAQETSNLAIRSTAGGLTLYTKYTGDINNYGVPGIKLLHTTLPNYGNLNGYFERLLPTDAPANTNTSYLSFVTSKPWTFFSMWLGNNDILGYASSGGAGDTPTDKTLFAQLYTNAANVLTATGAKGVVATIPDVLGTPYFTTVTLASLLAAVKVAAPTVTTLYIQPGTGPARAATAADLFTLTLSSANVIGVPNGLGIPYGLSNFNPIESKYVLDPVEAAVVTDYVNSYNAIIKSVAASKNLALVDANTLLKQYGAGKKVSGISVSAAFISGNLFSLDGIHLTPIGYSIVANEFINAINAKYGSSIPSVDVTKYRGVKFP